jgi:hypothetical protein
MISESTERYRRRIASLGPLAGLALASVGCSHAPEYSIFGSFFPAWIFCSVGGLVLMTGGRALIARTAIAEHVAAPVLFYLAMATFLACMLWLLFYS